MFERHKKLRTPHITTDLLADESGLTNSPTLATAMPKKRWTRVHQLLHDNHGVRYFVMALALIIAVGLLLVAIIANHQEPEPSTSSVVTRPKPAAPKYYSPLTGAETTEDATKRPVTAIMIENSPEARPQSGLKDAGVIYEAVAEGGITRFVALYQESRPQVIGPVRSVRPYYVEWASAYDPAIIHVGGSVKARQMASSGAYGLDIDEFYNAGTFWRATDRDAPHNVYTSFDKLDAIRAKKGKTTSNFTPYTRQDGKPAASVTAATIDIGVSSGQFGVSYTYDAASNSYIRAQGGVAHVDREGGQLAPSIVVAIKVNEFTAQEGDGYREQITTTGSGATYVFQNGTVTEGTWSRDSTTSPLLLKDAAGQPITFNRGQLWITALASNKGVSWR